MLIPYANMHFFCYIPDMNRFSKKRNNYLNSYKYVSTCLKTSLNVKFLLISVVITLFIKVVIGYSSESSDLEQIRNKSVQ